MVLTHQMKCVKPSAEGLFYPSTRARENPYYPIYVKNYVISQCEMTPASIGGGNKPVSVAGVNPPLRYTLSSTMLHRSIATHAKAREDAQGFVSVLCQLTLTRIPRQVSRARLEIMSCWIIGLWKCGVSFIKDLFSLTTAVQTGSFWYLPVFSLDNGRQNMRCNSPRFRKAFPGC